MAFVSCPTCRGLVPPAARACPHCDRSTRSWLTRAAVTAASGLAAVTLMACYGAPGYYDDCVDQDGDGWFPACYAPACDPTVDPNCDCDESDPLIHPGASDPLGDGIDQDCSGADGPGQRHVDGGVDAELDASVDAELDASVDAELDAGVDAELDASVDTELDASVDAP